MLTTHHRNPFSLKPTSLRAQFFGRQQETRRALDFLRQGQCVSVEGPTGIGKTSFLFHIAHPYIRADYKLAEEQIFVHFDGCSLADLDVGQCYIRIREETIHQIKNTLSVDEAVGIQLEKTVREMSQGTAFFSLRSLFRAAQAHSLSVVITLDNFDILAQGSCLEDEFFSALRALNTSFQMAYLVASQSPLYELERVRPEASPFFNIFQAIKLEPLSAEESRDLVVTLSKQDRVEFPEFIINHILELGQDEPCNLQLAGHIAFQLWQENGGSLRIEHREEVSRRFREKIEV